MTMLEAPTRPWYATGADEAAERLGVDPGTGLTPVEAADRLGRFGPNRLAEPPRRPRILVLVDQFRGALTLILAVAAVVSLVVSGEVKTPVVIGIVVVLNAVIGFVQEGKAERSLDALRKMTVTRAKVRRGATVVEVPSEDLVPGDIVLLEAGDRVPADGRILVAHSVEVVESALTGESTPVVKGAEPIDAGEVALAERRNILHFNTSLSRGRAEMVVTATGMGTEIGRIAGMLRSTPSERTPLQRQLDGLAHALAWVAGAVVAAVAVIGLLRGEPVSEVLLTAVALAVASIPEGLPAVVAVTLAIGTSQMARRRAIVKKLAAVETLGATSVICSDKTGTLTQNRMVVADSWAPTGTSDLFDTAALCADAVVRADGSEPVGDPTEVALVAAAVVAGTDVESLRAQRPRLGEVPFDSAAKFMATFHALGADGIDAVEVIAKGGPDVLAARATSYAGGHAHDDMVAHQEALAAEGLRVLAVARRVVDRPTFAAAHATGDLASLVDGLEVVGLAGLEDPPRVEAAAAIAECARAGIAVRMITGDHAATASAIAARIGIEGETVTGAGLDAMSDAELARRLDGIGVFARVAPEHKLRLVRAYKARNQVVAMTGDGVNDAPALKAADIGVAMGITGTEVTKEAASMVLADDNFATIVSAVRQGRSIYDNLVSFVRFQLTTTVGFAMTFLAAGVLSLAGGKPFTAIQVLLVNLIMDGPPAMALGVDPARPGIMGRSPRPAGEPILTRGRLARVVFTATVMAGATLAVLAWAPGPEPDAKAATVAGTMAFTTFVLAQAFNILSVRRDTGSVFARHTLTNAKLWGALGAVIAIQVVIVHAGPAQDLFTTTALSAGQWLACIGAASVVLWAEELRKLAARSRTPHPRTTGSTR